MINGIGNYIAKAAEYNMKDPSSFVKYTSAICNGFAFSAQSVAFSLNKEIPEKQRKFMVAQEVAEGVISTSILLMLASGFKAFGEKLVEKAKILPSTLPQELRNPESIKNILTQNTQYTEIVKKCKTSVGLATSILGVIAAFNVVTPILRNKIASYFQKKMQGNTETSNKQSQPSLQDSAVYKQFLNKQ